MQRPLRNKKSECRWVNREAQTKEQRVIFGNAGEIGDWISKKRKKFFFRSFPSSLPRAPKGLEGFHSLSCPARLVFDQSQEPVRSEYLTSRKSECRCRCSWLGLASFASINPVELCLDAWAPRVRSSSDQSFAPFSGSSHRSPPFLHEATNEQFVSDHPESRRAQERRSSSSSFLPSAQSSGVLASRITQLTAWLLPVCHGISSCS